MALGVLSRRRVSPAKVLSTVWMFVPLFCILVFLFTRSNPDPNQALGPADKTTVHKVNWTGAIPAEKTAYVYTHIGSRYDTTNRFIAILTSIEALRRTNTNRDIVVIIDSTVSPDQMTKLKDHGAIVHHISQSDNIANTKPSSPLGQFCTPNFSPLYAWTWISTKGLFGSIRMCWPK